MKENLKEKHAFTNTCTHVNLYSPNFIENYTETKGHVEYNSGENKTRDYFRRNIALLEYVQRQVLKSVIELKSKPN